MIKDYVKIILEDIFAIKYCKIMSDILRSAINISKKYGQSKDECLLIINKIVENKIKLNRLDFSNIYQNELLLYLNQEKGEIIKILDSQLENLQKILENIIESSIRNPRIIQKRIPINIPEAIIID
jgi:hypothetical protein